MNFDNIGEKIIKSVPLTLECYFVEKSNKEYKTGGKLKNRDLIVLKMRDYKTHKHVFTLSRWGSGNISEYEKWRDERMPLKYKEVHVKLEKECLYKYTWDDFGDGRCKREKVGEVHKDDDGNPVFYTSMVVYVPIQEIPEPFFEQMLKLKCQEIFKEHYVENDGSFEYISSLCYRNCYDARREAEKRRKAEENEVHSESEADYELVRSFWDMPEKEAYDRSDMSEEDDIMDALENGDAEKYGF